MPNYLTRKKTLMVKGCDECDFGQIVEERRSFSVLELGMAAIGASTSSFKEIDDFSLARWGNLEQDRQLKPEAQADPCADNHSDHLFWAGRNGRRPD